MSARRGRRCPAAAHAGAVCASLRLRCGAQPSVAPQNSLHASFTTFNNCDESDHEARCARRQASAPRRHRNRHRAPPAALHRLFSTKHHERFSKGASGQAAVRLWGAEQRRARGLARSASCHLTRRSLFERSARSARSEFCDGAAGPSSAGKSAYSPTAPAKRCGLPGRAFAARTAFMQRQRAITTRASASAGARSTGCAAGTRGFR